MQFFNFKNRNGFPYIFTAGVLTEIIYIFFSSFHIQGNISLYIVIYFLAFIIFFFSYLIILKFDLSETFILSEKPLTIFAKLIDHREKDLKKLAVPLVIITFGILFRLSLFSSSPTTSQDVYRYLWEGKVIENGFNPYITPPNDKKLDALQDEVYDKVTYKNIPAIYPPFSQFVFTASNIIFGENVRGLKIFYLLFELLTIIVLLKLLLLKKLNPNLIILYAWLPLPIMEYFINAHLDPIGVFFLILFIYLAEKKRIVLSAIPLALSFLSKLFPVLVIPLLFKKAGLKKTVVFCLVFISISIIIYLPFIFKNHDVVTAFFNYLSHWEFNGSVFHILKLLFADSQTIHLISSILLLVSCLTVAFLYKDFIKAVFGVFLCIVIFNSTLYPWYLGWIGALNPFVQFTSVMSLLFTINFSNFTPLGNVWKEYNWVLLVEYVPFFIFLAADLYYKIFAKRGQNKNSISQT